MGNTQTGRSSEAQFKHTITVRMPESGDFLCPMLCPVVRGNGMKTKVTPSIIGQLVLMIGRFFISRNTFFLPNTCSQRNIDDGIAIPTI
jgi:hypothetical protein